MDFLILLDYILQQDCPQQTIDELYARYGDDLEQEISRSQLYFAVAKESKNKINLAELQRITPSQEQELLPKEILFMSYIAGSFVNLYIPDYFILNYNVDFQQALRKFFSSGYIYFGDYITAVKNLKYEALKSLLSEYGLSKSGTVEIMRKRVLENIPSEDLAFRYDKSLFVLTDAGKKLLEKNSHIFYFHKNQSFGVSINEADQYKKAHPDASNRDIAICLLNDGEKYILERRYGLYRIALYNISIVYKDCSEVHNELYYLFCCCFMDCFGYSFNGRKSKQFAAFSPIIIERVDRIVKQSGLNISNLRSLFSSSIQILKIRYNPSDIDIAFDLLVKEIELGSGTKMIKELPDSFFE